MKRPCAIALLALLCLAAFIPKTAGPAATAGPSPTPTSAPSPTPVPAPSPTPTRLSADGALLLSFLDGKVEAVVDEDFRDELYYICSGDFEEGERFTFQFLTQTAAVDEDDVEQLPIVNLMQMAIGSLEDQGWEVQDVKASYRLLKTPGGREMLALLCVCPVGMDEFEAYFVFGVYDGEVRLTYAEDGWSRSDIELYPDLSIRGGGSAGAGHHFTWLGCIDETGHYRSVYQMDILSGPWVAMYAEMFDDYWATGCECYLLTTDEGEFYELSEGEDTDPEKLALLRQYLEEAGRTEVSDVDELIDAAMDAHGLTEDAEPFEDWWTPIAARTPEAQATFDALLAGDVSVLADPDEGQLWLIPWEGDWGLEYTYLDLDGDGQAELLAQLEDDPCNFNAVYHYEDGKLQAWQSDAMEMTCRDYPLADGTMVRQYDLSGNSSYMIFRYDAQGGETQLGTLSGREYDLDGNPDPHYTVDGAQVDTRTFADALNERVTQKLLPRSAWRPVRETRAAEGDTSEVND